MTLIDVNGGRSQRTFFWTRQGIDLSELLALVTQTATAAALVAATPTPGTVTVLHEDPPGSGLYLIGPA